MSYTDKSQGSEKRCPIGIGAARWGVAASREGVTVTRTEDANKLIAEYIEPNPYKSGQDQARIVGAGVSVWAFIANLQAINDDLTQAAKDYELPREAAEAAVHYYRRYKDLIDARITVNEAAFNSDTHPASR